jgi:acyl-CoA thioesterase-2
LHAYFLRPGDFNAPIVYEVDRARDGTSFTSRRVIAIQHGEQIFNMAASFQVPQQGLEHQLTMPQVPPPEELKDFDAYRREILPHIPDKLRGMLRYERPFEFRPVHLPDYFKREKLAPVKHVWFRAVDGVPGDQTLHRSLLAYVSDYHLLDAAMLPHGISWLRDDVRLASIDHAMWFHRDVRVDEWLLYSIDSPSASGARGLARGSIFARDGTLVASTGQEGLIRVLPPGA